MDLFKNPLDDRRKELLDFADRYERGAPYDDISEEEAVRRYREIVPELSGEEFMTSPSPAPKTTKIPSGPPNISRS